MTGFSYKTVTAGLQVYYNSFDIMYSKAFVLKVSKCLNTRIFVNSQIMFTNVYIID